ncbi:MAG: 5-(carboxyamino)imidazole ribonucleotide synthase [Crocinitomicaceae bacterium]
MRSVTGNSFRLGILGGGQLGRMFIQEAANFDVQVHILDGSSNGPAGQLATSFTEGDITNYEDVFNFGKSLDLLTVEIENVNIQALFDLEKEGVKVFPQPRVLSIIKDKGTQKEFYRAHNLPTSDFELLDAGTPNSELEKRIPFVQKLRTGGYDGRGVQVIRDKSDLLEAFSEPSLAEDLIDFEKELSVIVARNERGETAVFPTVECEFNDANLVEYLFSPADVSEEIEKKAEKLAIDVINAFEMVGILAVEMFLTKDGNILVNEVAPRPHNSGHHTIECNVTSQFEQHLRSIVNWPLGSTEIEKQGVMLNVLGAPDHVGSTVYEGLEDIIKIPGVYPHLYGKTTTKPNRKMGHITIASKSMEDAKKKADQVKQLLRVISV